MTSFYYLSLESLFSFGLARKWKRNLPKRKDDLWRAWGGTYVFNNSLSDLQCLTVPKDVGRSWPLDVLRGRVVLAEGSCLNHATSSCHPKRADAWLLSELAGQSELSAWSFVGSQPSTLIPRIWLQKITAQSLSMELSEDGLPVVIKRLTLANPTKITYQHKTKGWAPSCRGVSVSTGWQLTDTANRA